MRGKLIPALLGLLTAAALGFGGSQALASPAAAASCDATDHSFYLYCPVPRDCNAECAQRGYPNGGFCGHDCCACAY